MFKKNDKVKLIRPIDKFQKIGEVFRISNIIGHIIVFISEETEERGAISDVEISTYFEKVEEPAEDKPLKGVSYEKIEKLMAEANINVTTFFDKTTVVAAQFPNGFVITESSSCVDPKNYDEEEGKKICLKRIKERLWEMEVYFLQESLYQNVKNTKNEITDDFIEKVVKDLLDDGMNSILNGDFSVLENGYFINKTKEISKKYDIDFDELTVKLNDKLLEEIYKNRKKFINDLANEVFGKFKVS